MNCLVFECDEELIVVDCGITFPEVDAMGVDVVLPDFTFLEDNRDRVMAVFVTHGHEDHIGALPNLLRFVDAPVYGTAFTLGLVASKLAEAGLRANLKTLKAGEVVQPGCFAVEFIHINHSIPEAVSLAIRTPLGLVIHTSDFKVDYTPVSADPIDLARFGELGDEGVLLLLSDSTNVQSSGRSRSESDVAEALSTVVAQSMGRVLITMFSSNLHRLEAILRIAHANGRRVAIEGRSLGRNLAVAVETGAITLPSADVLVETKALGDLDDDEVIVVCTGSQGEWRSALARMAFGEHREITITPGDTVVFSARVIPGNERPVGRIIDGLEQQGARVITSRDQPVHTTGHAYRDELMLMMNLTRPQHFVPVHGEYRMLAKHARIARQLGVAHQHIITNGDILYLDPTGAQVEGRVVSGRRYLASRDGEPFGDEVLAQRRRLARAGVVVAWMDIDASGEILGRPEVVAEGLLARDEATDVLNKAQAIGLRAVKNMDPSERRDEGRAAEALRLALRRFFRKRCDVKPVVIARVAVIEIED